MTSEDIAVELGAGPPLSVLAEAARQGLESLHQQRPSVSEETPSFIRVSKTPFYH